MINVFVKPSALGEGYRDVSVLVDETHVNFGNMLVDDVLDILEETVHNIEVQIRELLNEEFNAQD